MTDTSNISSNTNENNYNKSSLTPNINNNEDTKNNSENNSSNVTKNNSNETNNASNNTSTTDGNNTLLTKNKLSNSETNNNNTNNNDSTNNITKPNNNSNDNNNDSTQNNGSNKSTDNNKTVSSNEIKQSPIDLLIQKLTSLSPQNKSKNKGKKNGGQKSTIGITAKNISNVCSVCRQILIKQPMLIEVAGPLKIVGDIHGQFYDLLRLFDLGGYPPECNYLFLGDYIDRGKHSLESIVLLFCFKIKFSQSFFLLRGNHECASINRIYGFYDECKRRFPKHGVKLWKIFTDCFNCLPIACLIDEKIFCMHGGLSPDLRSMNQIKEVQRPTDVPDSGLICDLLWSDPEPGINGWGENDRGVSWTFGPNVLKKFLNRFDMDLICRAHQVVEDGYEFFGQRRLGILLLLYVYIYII